MPDFLSPAWIARLDELARAAPELADAADEEVVIEQRVADGDLAVAYHLVLGPGRARVIAGPAPRADLTLVATPEAARRIHAGRANAQQCLAEGTLRLRGNPEILARRVDLLARVGDLFAEIRR